MKLLQLKIFKDVAYTKSFVKAGQRNFITQPSVSSHIKQLEDELQIKLFDRVPKRVALTQDGKEYLEYVEEILDKCENLLALNKKSKKNIKGLIRIASIHSIGMYELGPFLKEFMRDYPSIQIHLEYQNVLNIYESVQKREVDIGMVAYSLKGTKLKTKVYGEDKLCLIAPLEHRFSNKKQIDVQEIDHENFVALDTHTPTRREIDKFLKRNKVSVNIKMVNNNIFALKKAVEAGIGISIVPMSTVEDETNKGSIKRVTITGMDLSRPLAIISSKNRKKGKVEEIFISSLMKYTSFNKPSLTL